MSLFKLKEGKCSYFFFFNLERSLELLRIVGVHLGALEYKPPAFSIRSSWVNYMPRKPVAVPDMNCLFESSWDGV